MPKSPNQKLKLLYLKDYLERYTDDNHHVKSSDIIKHLASKDIDVERKTIYADIESLIQYGVDVNRDNEGYYVGEKDFQLSEIKLLVDAVQTSKFITQKKTLTLINKLENLANVYEAESLHRQVYVQNRIKSMNESDYVNVDAVSGAINHHKKIQFKYYFYKVDKTREFKHDGCLYEVSPYALIWNNQNYYLLGYDENAGIMKHYRVDKMKNIRVTDMPAVGKEVFNEIDMSTYDSKVFSMFGGETERVKLRFTNDLVDAVIDKFGNKIMIFDEYDGHFFINTEIQISPTFFSWVFAFKDKCEIVEPQSVRDEFVAMAENILASYEKKD